MNRQRLLTLIAAGMALPLVGPSARAQNELPAKPSPEMQKLGFLVGKWTMTGKIEPLNGTPFSVSGAEGAAWALGGRYLLVRETFTPESGAPTESLQLLGYDPQVRQYHEWIYAATAGAPGGPIAPSEEVGSFEGDRLVLTFRPDPATAGGLGIQQVTTPEGNWRVTSLLPGGAAAKAGLKVGDLITRVEGAPLNRSARPWIHGKVGTPVHLTVQSDGQERAITLIRQALPPSRIAFEPRSGGGYHMVAETLVGGRWQTVGELVYTAVR